MRSNAPRDKRTFTVYVIELDRAVMECRKFRAANPAWRLDKPCVYVGSTALSPEERFEQHCAGYKSNRYAHKFGVRLRPMLYRYFQGFETREEAEEAEAHRAESLREGGYAVWYGV
jgi:hypothetical protein